MNTMLLRRSALVVITLLLLGAAAPVSAYEEPKYTVEGAHEGFELRRYAPHVVVETTARGDFDGARNEAFMRLFRYIGGANRASAKLAMTIPVTSGSAGSNAGAAAGTGEKIAMTVPVTSSGSGADGTVMQFVVPSQYTLDTAPQPTDPTVSLRDVPARLIAARKYSGRSSRENYERELGELRNRIAAAGLKEAGEPQFAVYNGPFTPWFLRRNEVMIEVR